MVTRCGGSDGGCGGGAVVEEVVEAAYHNIIGCKDTNCGCVRREC